MTHPNLSIREKEIPEDKTALNASTKFEVTFFNTDPENGTNDMQNL